MKWYCLEAGIEHLMTGACFQNIQSEAGLQFEMSSPSIFTIWSDDTFILFWPMNNLTLEAREATREPNARQMAGRAEFVAKVVAPAMVQAWTSVVGAYPSAPLSEVTMEQMTWEQFSNEYCARQEQTPAGLKAVLESQIERFNSDGFMLLECQMMGGSRLGEYTILGFGGAHTYKEIPTHPISPRGLASDMSVVKGWVSRAQVITGQEP